MNFLTASPSLQRQAVLDLVQRARGGLVVHLLLWLLVGATGEVATRTPIFFWCVAGVFGSIMACRLYFEPRTGVLSLTRPRFARRIVLTLLLVNPAVWGLIAAVTVLWPPLGSVSSWIWLVVTGVAAAGGMSLAFDAAVRGLYAPLAVLPTVAAMLHDAPDRGFFPPIAAIGFLVYIHHASRVVHGDYWSAVQLRVELEHRAKLLEHLSSTDALTQVFNRMQFDRQAKTEWGRARRGSSAAVSGNLISMVVVDIDHFKRVNDTFGHLFGDLCLKAVAAALKSAIQRPADLLARYGGEEFVALLPGTDVEGAGLVAARMQAAVGAIAINHAGETVTLTCSIGVHTADSRDHIDYSIALGQADRALYQAKRGGRNRVVVFDQASTRL